MRSVKISQSLLVIGLFVAMFTTADVYAQDLSGPWSGGWRSTTNSHRGRLNATFCQNGNQLNAKFTGTFAKVLPFRYRTKLNIVSQQPGLTILAGSKKLGPIMGEFSYYAEVTDGYFNATYSSRRNHGTWTMYRGQ